MKGNTNDKLKTVSAGILLPILLVGLTVLLADRTSGAPPTEPPPTTNPTQNSVPSPEKDEIRVLLGNDVREMKLETYLVGVVLAEMPASFEEEALRAQAVAARTYTISKCLQDGRHGRGTICTDATCCQAYAEPEDYLRKGGTAAAVERMRRAVEDTKDLVVAYGNELIMATYFSCSGGITEDAVAVWGQDVPYLQAVESPGEENAVFFTETKSFTPEQFQNALGVKLSGPVDEWFGNAVYTDGKGIEAMVIGDVLYQGTQLRSLLQLRSTAFSITTANGIIHIQTRGYGHRVGMSQYGANAMALLGRTYEEILTHYYSGTEVVQYEQIAR